MIEGIAQLEAHRTALTGHCYRMLGSITEAEDAVQETLLRAWRHLAGFDGRSSLRTWLYRIATHVCLDARRVRRRFRPLEERSAGTINEELTAQPQSHWIEPIPDALAIPSELSPADYVLHKQSIRLAFVAALQRLPAKQRAALILTDVLGLSVSEVADSLDTTVTAIHSALQRARATLAQSAPSDDSHSDAAQSVPLSDSQARLLSRYVDAFHRYDTAALASLCREDVTFSMPPYELWLQGPSAVKLWLSGRGIGCQGSRLLPTAACGSPAFGQYRRSPDGSHVAWALVVLSIDQHHITDWCSFLDTQTLFPRFGLPLHVPANTDSLPANTDS